MEKKNMLEIFVEECKKVDSRINLHWIGTTAFVKIGNKDICVGGYNLPYQMLLITQTMNEQGSFS